LTLVVEIEGAHRLSPAEQEVLRLRVVAALEFGRVEGYRQAAEVFGVSMRSVGTWWRAYRRDGRDGLAVRPGRRPGPAELIGPEGRGTLFAAMVDCTPEELLDRRPVADPVGGGGADPAGCRDRDGRAGRGPVAAPARFTPRRPARRAHERQPAAVRTWLDEEHPAIEGRVTIEGAVIA
jgi:hypothetical protein